MAAQHLGNGAQRLVAGAVAIVIVVTLEEIHIHHRHGDRLALALGMAPAGLGAFAKGAAVEQAGKRILLRQVLQQAQGEEVMPGGVFEEVATDRADDVGGGQEEQVVQQHRRIEVADQLHGQVGEEGQPAAQRCHGETQAGEEVEEHRGQDDALVGQRKRVGPGNPDDAGDAQPTDRCANPAKPLQIGVQALAVGRQPGQQQHRPDQPQADTQHAVTHLGWQADGVQHRECQEQHHGHQ